MPAEKINPKNYQEMINALNTFAMKTEKTTSELYAACSACAQVLGEEDIVSQNLASHAGAIATKYASLAEEAREIARKMFKELMDHYDPVNNVWQDDSIGGDDEF